MYTPEISAEGNNEKRISRKKFIQIASSALLIGGLGGFTHTIFKSTQINKELNEKAPQMYTAELLQQARKEVVIFEEKTKQLILENKANDISSLAQNLKLKESIQIVHDQDTIDKKRILMGAELQREKHFYAELIASTMCILSGVMGTFGSLGQTVKKQN